MLIPDERRAINGIPGQTFTWRFTRNRPDLLLVFERDCMWDSESLLETTSWTSTHEQSHQTAKATDTNGVIENLRACGSAFMCQTPLQVPNTSDGLFHWGTWDALGQHSWSIKNRRREETNVSDASDESRVPQNKSLWILGEKRMQKHFTNRKDQNTFFLKSLKISYE